MDGRECAEAIQDWIEASESDVDGVLDLLADPYARHTVRYLSDRSATTIEELADVVAGLESVETGGITTPEDRERILIRLYHSVLPKLDAAGYVDFDTETYAVNRGEIPPVVRGLLERR